MSFLKLNFSLGKEKKGDAFNVKLVELLSCYINMGGILGSSLSKEESFSKQKFSHFLTRKGGSGRGSKESDFCPGEIFVVN